MFDVLVESHVRKPAATDLRNLLIASVLHAAVIAAVAAAVWFVIETVTDPQTPIVLDSGAVFSAPPPPAAAPPPGSPSEEDDPIEAIDEEPLEEVEPPIDPSELLLEELVPLVEETPTAGDAGGEELGVEGGQEGGVAGGSPWGTVGGVLDGGVPGSTGSGGEPGGGEPIPGDRPDVVPPVLAVKVEPDYPLTARAARIEGRLTCRAVIDTEGRVVDVAVVAGNARLFGDAAESALRQWRYVPARLDGRPVSVFITVFVDFDLH